VVLLLLLLQYIEGHCNFPHSVCFSQAALNDVGLSPEQLEDPTTIKLPKTGWLKVLVIADCCCHPAVRLKAATCGIYSKSQEDHGRPSCEYITSFM